MMASRSQVHRPRSATPPSQPVPERRRPWMLALASGLLLAWLMFLLLMALLA
jgi:hypothetical protein